MRLNSIYLILIVYLIISFQSFAVGQCVFLRIYWTDIQIYLFFKNKQAEQKKGCSISNTKKVILRSTISNINNNFRLLKMSISVEKNFLPFSFLSITAYSILFEFFLYLDIKKKLGHKLWTIQCRLYPPVYRLNIHIQIPRCHVSLINEIMDFFSQFTAFFHQFSIIDFNFPHHNRLIISSQSTLSYLFHSLLHSYISACSLKLFTYKSRDTHLIFSLPWQHDKLSQYWIALRIFGYTYRQYHINKWEYLVFDC